MNLPTLFPMLMVIMISAIGDVSSSVSCGSHKASRCSQCPQGNGASYCHGDCHWKKNNCVQKAGTGSKSSSETESEALKIINIIRAEHGVSPLRISSTLNRYARNWATARAKGTVSGHGGCNECGQNIWGGSDVITTSITDIVKAFYTDEMPRYYENKKNPGNYGHFTALIWKATTEMGVADVSANGQRFVVFNFNPPANLPGAFRANILPHYNCKSSKFSNAPFCKRCEVFVTSRSPKC